MSEIATYSFPDGLKAQIEERAEKEGRSASAMAARLLKDALGPKPVQKAPDWAEECMELFWQAYPRKTNRKKALELLRSMIVKEPSRELWRRVIMDARRRFQGQDARFIPHPTTYLNGRRWEDDHLPEPVERPQSSLTKDRGVMDIVNDTSW